MCFYEGIVLYVPQKAIEIAMPHVFKHHGQRFSICADTIEPDNVLVLKDGQQLCFPLEVLSG